MTLLVGIVVVGGAAPISGAQLDDAAAIHEQLPAELEQAVKFRATFGFETGESFVERIADDPAYSADPYGVPLSTLEIAEMQRRIGIERAAQPGVDFAMKQPGWAGYYIDQPDQGTPVFLFTGALEDARAGIAAAIPGTPFRVAVAKRSLADLYALQADIDADTESLRAAGVDLSMTGVDITANLVTIGIDGLTDDLAQSLIRDYGEGIQVRDEPVAESDACSGVGGTQDCRPMKGGLWIYNSSGGERVHLWLHRSALEQRCATGHPHCGALHRRTPGKHGLAAQR